MFSTGGFSQLSRRTCANDDKEKQVVLPKVELKQQLNDLVVEKRMLQNKLTCKLAEVRKLKQELAAAKKLNRDNNSLESAKATQTQAKKKLDEPLAKAEDKKKRLKELEEQKSILTNYLNKLKDVSEQRIQLAEELQKVKAKSLALKEKVVMAKGKLYDERTVSPESTPLVNLQTDRTPVYVALIKNTIVPVCEPYYKFSPLIMERGNGYFEKVTRVSRNDIGGEPIEQALFAGSDFAKFLKGIDLSKNFIALLVDSSSFEAFRNAREMLRNRSIPFGWIPCLSPSDFYFNSRGGVQVGELWK